MSNAAVGPVYDAIIQEVINAVRVDFEENGVDDGVLEDLKKVRCLHFSLVLPAASLPALFALALALALAPVHLHAVCKPNISRLTARCIALYRP